MNSYNLEYFTNLDKGKLPYKQATLMGEMPSLVTSFITAKSMYSWILDTSNSPNSVLYLVYWLGCFPFPNNRHQDLLLFFKGYVCHLLNLKRNQLNRQVAMEFRGQKTQVSSPSMDPMDQMKTTSEILRVVNGYQLPVFQSTIGCKICVKN